jgi:hypothetical protein
MHGVLEFADVAGPGALEQCGAGLGRQHAAARPLASAYLRDEVLGQGGDVAGRSRSGGSAGSRR